MTHLLYNTAMYLSWGIAFALFAWNWRKYRLRNPDPLPMSIFTALVFTSMFMSRLSPKIFQGPPLSILHWVILVYCGAAMVGFYGRLLYLLMHRKAQAQAVAGNHFD